MNNYSVKVFNKIKDLFNSSSMLNKSRLLVLVFCIILGISIISYIFFKKTYIPLMTNLNIEDSTNIIRVLREKKIPFKFDASEKIISIPSEKINDLRLELASIGLPQTSVVGYELFDKQSFGTTTFVQKLNQKRAQEGELMRTINTIKGVKHSRVHLSIPQKSTFTEDQKKSTASVVVDLDVGVSLSDKQVFGITNLIARAVEGLDVSDIIVMNSDGKVLSKNSNDSFSSTTIAQLEYQEKIENDLEKRIDYVLSRVVGEGHVVSKVSADLDFSQINETETLYDSDGATVRSVEKHTDSMSGVRPGVSGIAGSVNNIPLNNIQKNNNEIRNQTNKNNEITNYEIPQTIRKTIKALGGIKKLSIAIVIDGKTKKVEGKNGEIIKKIEVWPPEKVKEFEEIASHAVGLDTKRGDTLEIKSIEFTNDDFEDAQKYIFAREKKEYTEKLFFYGLIGFSIVLFFIFLVRPSIKWITKNAIDSAHSLDLNKIEEIKKAEKNKNYKISEKSFSEKYEALDPVKAENELIKEKIISLVNSNPHKAALILKEWLHEVNVKKSINNINSESQKIEIKSA